MMKRFLFSSLLFTGAAYSLFNPEEYRILDEIALRTGADKGSHFHNYTEVYSQYFYPLRDQPIRFLEIGLFKGKSARMWEEYFPEASLHFIDCTLDFVEYYSGRSNYYLADQENPADLKRVVEASGGDFDIILDDGGHTMNQQIVSFRELFPHVKSGGLYIIEDLHTSYWPGFGGGNHPGTAIAFLKGLIDDVNAVGNLSTKASHLKIDPALEEQLSYYQKTIYGIHFYDSVAIIMKRRGSGSIC